MVEAVGAATAAAGGSGLDLYCRLTARAFFGLPSNDTGKRGRTSSLLVRVSIPNERRSKHKLNMFVYYVVVGGVSSST
jgi:thiamine biosynthesis protein ThiC